MFTGRENGMTKLTALKEHLKALGQAAVAFSGGVDSTFLLKVACEVLGSSRVCAITVKSPLYPQWEQDEAAAFCRQEGIRQIIISSQAHRLSVFRENPPDRCYICKRQIFQEMKNVASKEGFVLVDGTNKSDEGDYRPGLKALKELGIVSPLRDVDLTKEEIRILSRQYGLSTFQKPSFACLATRFVYGEEITAAKLKMVEEAEAYLKRRGFKQYRVRMHQNMARIEVLEEDFALLLDQSLRQELVDHFDKLGFSYVTLDLNGYQMGSMNKVLTKTKEG